MSTCALLADEVTAAGFRLAGGDVHVPDDADLARRFEQLCEEVPLLLVTAELAGRIPPAVLRGRQRTSRALVLVIADARGRCEPEALGAALRRQLGMAE
jgi:vacuolar-type H+-ATPase subunit F/Vma7